MAYLLACAVAPFLRRQRVRFLSAPHSFALVVLTHLDAAVFPDDMGPRLSGRELTLQPCILCIFMR